MDRIVSIKQGRIRGIAGNRPSNTVFKGIPFAKPPVGELRWKAPVEPDPWEGVLDCARFRCPCWQIPLPQGSLYQKEFFPAPEEFSEDCLYLSVWTPSMCFDPAEKLPVMVWYHGGAYIQGYDHEPEFDGEAFNRNGVILVTVPYRLGVFGYLAHPDLTEENGGVSGNFAVLDQIFALQWVKENISAFGGDPDNVTIFGQSAGGGSVQAICASPLARGLFRRAIIQSANALQSLGSFPKDTAEEFGKGFSEYLGMTIAEMRQTDAKTLLYKGAGYVSARNSAEPLGLRFVPCVDGVVIPKDPGSVFVNGENADVSYMMGSVAGDNGLFGMPDRDGFSAYKETVERRWGGHAQRYLDAMGVHDDETLTATEADRREASAMAASEAFAGNRLAKNGKAVYTYHFNRDMPGDDHPGAFHSSELWYVFGTLYRCHRPFSGADYELSRVMNAYWCNFAKSGDPNGEGLPKWLPHTADADAHMLFNEKEVRLRPDAENPLLIRLSSLMLDILNGR